MSLYKRRQRPLQPFHFSRFTTITSSLTSSLIVKQQLSAQLSNKQSPRSATSSTVYSPNLPKSFARRYLRCYDSSISPTLTTSLLQSLKCSYFSHHEYETGWRGEGSTRYFSYLFEVEEVEGRGGTVLGEFLRRTMELAR